jgi:hypothetical protein
MRVELDGIQYRFWWEHTRPDPLDPDKDPMEVGTACFVVAEGRTPGDFDDVYHAYLYYKDRFSKELGRKASLAGLLQKGEVSRANRARVWQAYFER